MAKREKKGKIPTAWGVISVHILLYLIRISLFLKFYGSGMGKGYISLYSISSQPMAERSHGQNLEAGSMRETMRDHEGGLLFGSLPGFAQPVGF